MRTNTSPQRLYHSTQLLLLTFCISMTNCFIFPMMWGKKVGSKRNSWPSISNFKKTLLKAWTEEAIKLNKLDKNIRVGMSDKASYPQ